MFSTLATGLRKGRVTFCLSTILVFPKQAVPLYAGLRNMAHTVDLSHGDFLLRVGI